MVTAELPAALGRPRAAGAYAASNRRPGHRVPAPVLLRFLAWLLGLALVVAVAGLVALAVRPDWLAFLRNTAPAAARVPAAPSTGSRSTTSAGLVHLSSTAAASTYTVPVSRYEVVVQTGAGRCFVAIKSPPGEAGWAYAQTLPAGVAPKIPEQGAISVKLGATASSLAILDGSRVIGTIANPRPDYLYVFQPSTG